jgi:two-component system alkaline phosphatase synthesis response regulator PhoP
LVVEDEQALAQVLAIRLEAAGFEVELAANGLEGLCRAIARSPDVLLLDVRLPDLDGLELHARLRSHPARVELPVVFLSANVQDSARQRALGQGAHAYLTKPYDPREVVAALREAIVARAARKET